MHKSLFTHGVVYLFVTVASMVATPARSDQAFLKSGDRISGKLVWFEENLLVFQTDVAGTARLLRKDLLAIASTATVTVVFTNGAHATGRLTVGVFIGRDAGCPGTA